MPNELEEWQVAEHKAFAVESRDIDYLAALLGSLLSSVPLAIGVATGHRTLGLFASLGGLNVALGLSSGSRTTRLKWGFLAFVGSTIGVALATLLHNSTWLSVVVTLLWVGCWALLRVLGPAGILVAFINSAVFIIVNGQSAGLSDVIPRTAAYGVGGAIALVPILLIVRPRPENEVWSNTVEWSKIKTAVTSWNPVRRHALRAGIIVGLGTALYRIFNVTQGYWIPLSTVAVIQPDGNSTRTRAIQRALGTLAGVAIAAVVVAFTHSEVVLVLCVFLCSGALFALKDRGYHWLVILLTPTVIFMLSAVTFEGWQLIQARVVDNAIGIALALAVVEIWDRLFQRAHDAR